MSEYGINVPPGIAVTKIEDVLPAAKKMANKENEASLREELALTWLVAVSQLAGHALLYPSYTPVRLRIGLTCSCVQVVVKSQILAGGRGLGSFKNGFKGGVHIVKVDQVEETAKKMLGQTLVTKQTGPAGKPVGTLFIASKMNLAREMYFAILTDRGSAEVLMIGCGEGAH